jgi:hypothetical protein
MRCRHCGGRITEPLEKVGARCPHCRQPLYERSEAARRRAQASQASSDKRCAVHPSRGSAGACERCGNFMCWLCRTRWNDKVLCLSCAERAVALQREGPVELKTHRRQALWGVILGVLAWGLVLAAIWLFFARGGRNLQTGPAFTALLLGVSSAPLALFGVGLATAAVRLRGNRMRLATCGLVLTAAHLGLLFGVFLLIAWNS